MPWPRRLRKSRATRGGSDSWLTSFPNREARMTGVGRLGGGVAGEAVGVREEVTLERRGIGREIGDKVGAAERRFQEFVAPAQTGGLDGLGDVEDVVALGDGERDGVDIAAQDAGVDLSSGRGVVEAVFAGEQPAAFDGAEEIESEAAADDPRMLELAGDGHGPGAGGDVDVGWVGSGTGSRAEGSIDRIRREGGRDQRQ